jgi:hypothetical protein
MWIAESPSKWCGEVERDRKYTRQPRESSAPFQQGCSILLLAATVVAMATVRMKVTWDRVKTHDGVM